VPSSATPQSESSSAALVPNWVIRVSIALTTFVCIIAEVQRWANEESRTAALTGWLAGPTADWLPFLPVLISAPLWWRIGARPRKGKVAVSRWELWRGSSAATSTVGKAEWIAAGAIFALGFFASQYAGSPLQGMPPAYHDEYSYLFQAQTHLHGRWWFPSHPQHPEWFDQMHVLNLGKFASRYFPGNGFWMVPFVWLGDPWLGHHLAQGLCAMLMYWIGRELSTNGVGLFAGILFSLSPGLLLFSNLLLAHLPTLVGLLTFCWAFLSWLRTGQQWRVALAGTGLAFAMICRPMTAAGFALPFGVIFGAWWLLGRNVLHLQASTFPQADWTKRTAAAGMMVLPLTAGLVLLMIQNHAITGSVWKSPYQLYTDIHTPRHRYGFNNVIIGEQNLGPQVLENYDRWAENLTPTLAVKNVGTRLENSLRWTLGIVPLMLAGIVGLLTLRRGDHRWGLVWGAIISLHLAHIPYWFSGIMGWHYVFESAPMWLLIFAESSRRLMATWRAELLKGPRWWWGSVIAVALAVNLVTVVPVWPGRVQQGLAELAFARQRYHQFRVQVDELRGDKPALVLVIPDETDRHMDYVTNLPTLDGPVLVARIRDRQLLREAAAEYPDRVPVVFDQAARTMTLLPTGP
jgi:4-amino-4-deoxy-L-arabinose transferase and related glycosyltransferases of PMT family